MLNVCHSTQTKWKCLLLFIVALNGEIGVRTMRTVQTMHCSHVSV